MFRVNKVQSTECMRMILSVSEAQVWICIILVVILNLTPLPPECQHPLILVVYKCQAEEQSDMCLKSR